MNELDFKYKQLVTSVLKIGSIENNRTGVNTLVVPSWALIHNMENGFPLMTHKKMPFKTIAVELEGFIKGITSKKWFQDRGCHIWDEWCSPLKVPYGTDEEIKLRMLLEDDLGPIYGAQWRNFHDSHCSDSAHVDQLTKILTSLQSNPYDRRMICSAWNPAVLYKQALPPCHVLWQVNVIGNKLHLSWYQRSCDLMLGIPFNIASYGLLLELLAKHSGYKAGTLTGFLTNVHIYENQIESANKIIQIENNFELPKLEIDSTYLFDWDHTKSRVVDYQSGPKIEIPLAV